jgi:ABC-type glutathione transport system ATPase component
MMLSVRDLTVSIGPEMAPIDIVSGVSFDIGKGEILGLVGESGCGKSMTSLAVMGLLPQPGPRIRGGRIDLVGADVTQLQPWQRVEAGHGRIAMIFQEPMTSLNPVRRIGDQIAEAVRVHDGVSGAAAQARAHELLDLLGLSDRREQVPAVLSGGQRQRLAIARALVNKPTVLLADEPTGALDTEGGQEVLELFRRLHNDGQTIIMVTHSPDVAAGADRQVQMRDGQVAGAAATA